MKPVKTAKTALSTSIRGEKQKNNRVLHVYYVLNEKGTGWRPKTEWLTQ